MNNGVPYSSELKLGAFETGRTGIVTAAKPGLISGDMLCELSSYVIGGSNYFKLGDILSSLGIAATDDGTGELIINTIIDAAGTETDNAPSEAPGKMPAADD